MNATTYDVRVWKTNVTAGARGKHYQVRWSVAGRARSQTFSTAKLADSFRSTLVSAARKGELFDVQTGRPAASLPRAEGPTWFTFAMDFIDMKWPEASPRHRQGTVEALVTITGALTIGDAVPPDPEGHRAALRNWAFNAPARAAHPTPPDECADAIAWTTKNSRPLAELADPAVLRNVLDAIGRTLTGDKAAPSTSNRKRATLTSAIGYAIERGHLDANPMPKVKIRRRKVATALDTRAVVNHAQARALLVAVRDLAPDLEAFYACIYYAAMRPGEVRNLRADDLTLPATGWGEAVLSGSYQDVGRSWTDDGARGEERELKHRTRADVRRVPLTPQLVAHLRSHLDSYETGSGGRLFVNRVGPLGHPVAAPYSRPVSTETVSRVWRDARTAAFTTSTHDLFPTNSARSPLARRPYDLRHACVSTWLAAGVAPTQVAAWAGHSVAVLLTVYAHAIDGQAEQAQRRITEQLGAGGST
jgi:integrase